MESYKAQDPLVKELIENSSSNFKWAKRIDFRSMDPLMIEEQLFSKGLPLVISNTTLSWRRDRDMFGWEWLKKNFGKVLFKPRDNDTQKDITPWTIADYIEHHLFASKDKRLANRILARDIQCPNQWKEFVSQRLPQFFARGSSDLIGDLMLELQPDLINVEIGSEETSTPGHIEIMGTVGHNLMVYADEGAYALWLCVSASDRDKANAYWKQVSGSLYSENYMLSISQLEKAPFTIQVIEQREGDFVLLPPEAAHQVINKSGRCVKIAWNTMPYQTIQTSYTSTLPLYRSFGKPEVCRVKAVAYYGLLNRIEAVSQGKSTETLADEFPPLLSIVEDMIESEWIEHHDEDEVDVMRFTDDNVPHTRICDFCKCDIWNRCYHCAKCGKDTGYDICLDCFAEGRGCLHKAEMELTEYISMKQIQSSFENAKETYTKILRSAKRKKNKKKKLVEWKPSKSGKLSIATIAFRLSLIYRRKEQTEVCHQCEKAQPYNIAIPMSCGSCNGKSERLCDKVYCTKCLWNRYGIKMIDCLKTPEWVCPFCKGVCNCNPCLEKRGISPTEFSCEEALGDTLEGSFPFSLLGLPNIPCVSDFKPVFQTHVLKKRKMYSLVTNTPPSPPTVASPPPRSLPVSPHPKSAERPRELFNGSSSAPQVSEIKMEEVRNNGSSSERIYRDSSDVTMAERTYSTSPPSTLAPSSSSFNHGWDIPNDDGNREELIEGSDAWKDAYGHHEIDHKSTILVRNLSYSCTSADLGELFKTCGPIDQITIPVDKATNKLRGYGFVKFQRREYAEDAMKRFNSFMLKDRVIELEWSVDKTSRKLMDPRNSVCYKCGKEGHYIRNCPKASEPVPPPAESSNWDRRKEWEVYERDREYQDQLSRDKDKDGRRELRGYICFKCGKEGHVASDCLEREDNGPGFKGVICFKCGQGGHLANKCDKRVRGCFLCGKDGHIASECTEKVLPRDYLLAATQEERFPKENGGQQTWESSQKYRRVSSPERDSVRAPVKDPAPSSWDDRDRDRERGRDRKLNGWDSYDRHKYNDDYRYGDRSSSYDRDPRMSRDSRDSRYSSSRDDPRYSSSRSEHSDRYENGYSSHSSHSTSSRPSYSEKTTPPPNTDYSTSYTPTMGPPSTTTPPPTASNFYSDSSQASLPYTQPAAAQIVSLIASGQIPLESLQTALQMASQPAQTQQYSQPPANQYSQYPSSSQPPASGDADNNEKRKKFKSQASNIVVNRLSKYFNSGQISSKDDFKMLSRKIIHTVMEKEHPRYQVDEARMKKYIDLYYQQYATYKQKGSSKTEQWLQQLDSSPPKV